jgi:WD40-like Beta Propeller Repeat
MQYYASSRRWLMFFFAMGSVLSLVACGPFGSRGNSSTGLSHVLVMTSGVPHQLTFYEGEDDNEPNTPFYIHRGIDNTMQLLSFVPNEGAYYLATYDSTTWQEQNTSNGFSPSDPLWDCDDSPDNEISIDSTGSLLSRSCEDGSVTIFTLPTAVSVYHAIVAPNPSAVTARVPAVTFAPQGQSVAITDDGPGGIGQHIVILSTRNWQTLTKITITGGLLSQPSWSPDGSYIAAVDVTGMLHIWSARDGHEVANIQEQQFSLGSAMTDPSEPDPQWSPDGSYLYTITPSANNGSVIASFKFDSERLTSKADAMVSFSPDKVDPLLSPDGSLLFIRTGLSQGRIVTTSDLRQASDFALSGTLIAWGIGGHELNVFTLNATVIPMQISEQR